ncbi:DEAD/DEAH box helicase [Paucibacter sp. APW11]|uniref:DEAD/DEAH box helicase n=1 Tax=Roseateles aquae TaxID=3077235 RepID=A0ABU3PHV8_9BURK|nr:DEAD/DEAH box helicase [Paucibacter sp. APW11]MDT9002039.1 DEAD/DEAH box helicase [Paucibacter sp. APW11]
MPQVATAHDPVLDALLLMGGSRGAGGLALFLQALDWDQAGDVIGHEASVKQRLQQLHSEGQVLQPPGKGYLADASAHAERLQALLRRPEASLYWQAMVWAGGGGHGRLDPQPRWVSLRNRGEMVSLLRLLCFAGLDLPSLKALLNGPLLELNQPSLLAEALLQPWLPEAFGAIAGEPREWLLARLLAAVPAASDQGRQLREWMQQRAAAAPEQLSALERVQIAERRLLALQLDQLPALIAGLPEAQRALIEAGLLAQRGDWQAAAAGFEAAFKLLRGQSKQRRELCSDALQRLYVLSLLAQPDPKAWTQARKHCVNESGSRKPSPYEWWGLWAHAIAVRLGDEALEPEALAYLPGLETREHALEQAANRLLLAAWLGREAPGWPAAAARTLRDRLLTLGETWLAAWLDDALQRLDLGVAPLTIAERPAAMLAPPQEAWRDALAAIVALDQPAVASPAAAEVELAWSLRLDEEARIQAILPLERSEGARGQLKLKPVTWSRLKKLSNLLPRDAAVLRHLERPAWGGVNSYQLDLSAALQALLGHPAVMFDDAPGQWVELVEAQPELEVLRRPGPPEQFEFRIHPPLSAATPPRLFDWQGSNPEVEIAKRNSQRVLRDGPRQARLLRISAAQRRVAELLAQGWTVPASASAELSAALQVLAGHFHLHSDAAGGQLVEGDSRLRARLAPQGEGLTLQLVAQPFGAFGPAVTPGLGRERLLCLHEGLSLATERDLATEAAHRRAVLEALPFLDAEQAPELPWLLDDAEDALHAVELLPTLPAIAALDWPKGRALRVQPASSEALNLSVSSGRDWLGLNGSLRVDEGQILSLQQLMQLARGARSRFVSLGEGQYLALSERLRQQLHDLDALGQQKKGQLQLPLASASWLEDTLDGVQLSGDADWQQRVDALAAAATQPVQAPAALRAELRGYQFDGYAWMLRLARAGLGACLADDMGLGKTVQTLALLIERAALGPALVLAPTSVCANWLAEAERFAPGLRVQLYGEGGQRQAQIESAAAGDVLIASYALAQIDAELFASRPWASLVMDEAQALKNATTKRAKSVAEFEAGFRLALSGTPVENRLADLWSIMNLINPGLLGSASQFNERFAQPIERQQDPAVRARLRRIVAPFLLRRTKAQVLQDLPPRTEIVHLVQPGPQEQAFLEALRREAKQSLASQAAAGGQAGGATLQVLAELMRLRRAACDPRLVAPELGLAGAKADEFERVVAELVAGRHKALVFSQFTDFLKLLAARLDAMGLAYQYLDGSTPAAERARRVAAFQRGEGELFLISLKAGGFGLNLTMADYVLIVDPWWNPAAEDQAMGRAHRMGQQRPVTVYRLVTAGSIEERIIELHRDKRSLADSMLEGQDQAEVLDARALAALLLG